MSTIKLKGSSSGEAEVTVAAAAGTPTFTLPTTVGSANQLLKNSGTAGTLEYSSNLTFDGDHVTQTIDASGEGINQTAAGNHYIDNFASSNRTSANGVIWRQTADWNGKTVAQIKLSAGADTTNKDDGEITFWTSAANDNDERMKIGSDGDVTINSGNLVIGTSGKGIDFSATSDGTTMSNELLDDYEEGTWTPSPRFGGSGAGTSGSYNGQYVKIGKQVTVWFSVGLTDKGSFSSSDLYTIVNLPFTGSSSAYSGFAPGYVHRMSSSKQLVATINNSSTIDLGLASTGSGANNDGCFWDDVQDDTHIIGTMTYFV